MVELSNSKIKSIMARARLMKARCHIGMNGLQPNTLAAFIRAFDGSCVRPEPSDVVRVKVHSTFSGDLDAAIASLCRESGSVFDKQEREWLTFWKPHDNT